MSIVSFLICFFTWIYGQETTAGNSSLVTDSENRSDSSSDKTISAQYSFAGTIIAAVLAAGVGIYSAISNNKQSNRNNDLQLELTKLNTEQNEKNNSFQIELASINAKLASQKSEEDAHRDYKYEALKRLYLKCEPVLFQLVELSDYGMWRILGLADDAREGRLKDHLSNVNTYSFKTTIYRLIAPMAAFRLLQSQLTLVDLSLDPRTSIQYDIAKAIYFTFSSDYAIAKSNAKLDYKPEIIGAKNEHHERLRNENPAVYTRQSIFVSILENVVSDLIIYDERLKKDRVMRYGEFENTYFGKETEALTNKEELNTIVRVMFDFHPNTRPVLWRMLIIQAMLYDALDLRENKDPPYIKTLERKRFEWRQNSNEATDDEVLNQPFIAAQEYLQNQEKRLYDKLVNGIDS